MPQRWWDAKLSSLSKAESCFFPEMTDIPGSFIASCLSFIFDFKYRRWYEYLKKLRRMFNPKSLFCFGNYVAKLVLSYQYGEGNDRKNRI